MGVRRRGRIDTLHPRDRVAFVIQTGGLCEVRVQRGFLAEEVVELALRRDVVRLDQDGGDGIVAGAAGRRVGVLGKDDIRVGAVALFRGEGGDRVEWCQNRLGLVSWAVVGDRPPQ